MPIRIPLSTLLLIPFLTGCAAGESTGLVTDLGVADTASPPPRFSSGTLAGAGTVTEAIGLHRAGGAPMVIVVAREAGGVSAFIASPTGAFTPTATALSGVQVTGLAAVRV